LADGCAEIIFHYNGKFAELEGERRVSQSSSMIHAQSQRFRRFETKENFGIFGAYLYPFAIPYIFSVPALHLSNLMPDLHSFLGSDGNTLEDQIMCASDNQERARILSAYLTNRILKNFRKEPPVFAAVNYIIHTKGLVAIEKLAHHFCLSPRQFERKFKEFAGFTPKLYSRIIRFGNTANEYGNKTLSLTEIAYKYGYYDQSHFIHDFKEFSGFHPGEYFYGKPEGAEYREV
jgi:AraC-like DNA-binding protein